MSRSWKVRGTLHEVRLGASRHRVFRVRWSSSRAVLALAHADRAYDMYVDRVSAMDLVTAWCLAARSPHSLVWLPMRANPAPRGLAPETEHDHRPLDLALVRSEVAFPVHEWKRVRSALRQGRAATARVPEHEFAASDDVDWAGRHELSFQQAAETLFVVGTRTAFDRAGTYLTDLVTEAPGYLAEHPERHYCVELYRRLRPGRLRRDMPRGMHIEYCPGWAIAAAPRP